MSDGVCHSVYDSLQRAIVHTPTFSENGLAMRAGLATLETLEREDLGSRAAGQGRYPRHCLTAALSKYEMVAEIRGAGMLSGIEFIAPPLVVSTEQIGRFVSAIGEVVDLLHSSSAFWTGALGPARRAAAV